MNSHVPKALFSVPDFMAATSVGRTKVYELIGSGELETVTIGRRRLIPAQSLEDWVNRLRDKNRAARTSA